MQPMLYRFSASGSTPQNAFAAFAAEESSRPHDPMFRRADLSRVAGVVVIEDRAPLRALAAAAFGDAYAAFDSKDGALLSEDEAEWLADRLIEDDDPRISSGRTGPAGALLMDTPGSAPTWLFFGWTDPAD